MTANEWYHRFDGSVSMDVIKSIQKDARAGMIEVSELDETIAFLKDAYELATSPNRALKYHYDRLKALRNEHT